MNLQKTVNGIEYVSIPEKQTASCIGCVCYNSDTGTSNSDCYHLSQENCTRNRIIWIRKEDENQMIPLDKAIELAVNYFYSDDTHYGQTRFQVEEDFHNYIEETLEEENRLNDPEYQKYLELKKKFG